MTETLKTKEYDLFKLLDCNRPIRTQYVKELIFSIQSKNLLAFRPILVDSEMKVIDGQHRLEAARILGVDIYYQINIKSTEEDIVLLNRSQKRWDVNDYVNYYKQKGLEDYVLLYELHKNKNKPISVLLRSLGRDSSEQAKKIRLGTFKFPEKEQLKELDDKLIKIEKIMEIIHRYVIVNNEFLKSNRLLLALCSFLTHPKVVMETLILKITTKSDSIKPCGDIGGYYSMIKNIYNWKNQDPIE